MERECLRLLLRGKQPVVVCPARGIDSMRIPPRLASRPGRRPLTGAVALPGHSPTPDGSELAAQRNEFVASVATRVFIAHAAPGSKTEAFARNLAGAGKPMLTLDSPANENLVEMGADVVGAEGIAGGVDLPM